VSTRDFLVALALIEGAFILLDLVDRHLTRASRYGGARLRPAAVVFFGAVCALFVVVQLGLAALAPNAERLVAAIRAALGGPAQPPPGPRGVVLVALSVALFYVAGFWDYLWHRCFSHSRWFWFTHEYHHLPNQVFVGMPGIFARPFAVATTIPVAAATAATTFLALRLFRWPLWDWTIFHLPLLLSAAVLTASHSSFLRRSWWSHRIMRSFALTTPHEHLLHHTVDLVGNYGNFTSLWDRLLGTYLDPRRPEHQGRRVGLGYDQDFLGTLTVGLLRVPPEWRRRAQLDRYCNLDG
jgi:sterol desaturase/sphingolipid hydroxylase (fatty acid hydroxylase superfamily)